ncbi:Organic solute transporter Ost-alpha [Artemisia annua]|uniref:Organic solute transporter Ost-alpha n=1 Tax=Artemisia annua TaxID=35608 RepID=A0A2U1PG65_ARTAN|nr:Organic solute transporter Ost-alpha [Artemisia annua]
MDLSKLNREELTLLGAGACTMATLHFSSQLASQHLYYWKTPKEQRAILIIILAAPVFAVNSFVSVLDINGSKPFFMLLNSIKECYEALVIATFLSLLYTYLNISVGQNIVPDEIKGREMHHSFPMTLFQPRIAHLNHQTLKLLNYWIWQFVVTRPTCSFLMMGLKLLGMYPTWVSWIFTIILSISIYVAMYSLVVFYHTFAKELEPHKPLAKFLCVNGIVFFCFGQGVFIDILAKVGVIKSHHFWLDVEHVEEAIRNVLICVEMLLFSVFQQYAFHVEPYSGAVQSMLQKGKKNEVMQH